MAGFGVMLVHFVHVASKQGRFVAAGAGADFDYATSAIRVLAADGHVEQFVPNLLALFAERRQFGFGQLAEVRVFAGEHFLRLGDLLVELLEAAILGHQLGQRTMLARHEGHTAGACLHRRVHELPLEFLEAGQFFFQHLAHMHIQPIPRTAAFLGNKSRCAAGGCPAFAGGPSIWQAAGSRARAPGYAGLRIPLVAIVGGELISRDHPRSESPAAGETKGRPTKEGRPGKLRFGLGFGDSLLATVEAGIARAGELVLEFFDPSGGVDELQLAGVKGVANIANIDLQLRPRAAGGEGVAATAFDRGNEILGVNVLFHGWGDPLGPGGRRVTPWGAAVLRSGLAKGAAEAPRCKPRFSLVAKLKN